MYRNKLHVEVENSAYSSFAMVFQRTCAVAHLQSRRDQTPASILELSLLILESGRGGFGGALQRRYGEPAS